MRAYNSTITLKEKKCTSCGKPCVWFSNKRCRQCATIEDTLAREEQKTDSDEDLGSLVRDLDSVFSQFIRLKYADSTGFTQCYTCNTTSYWSGLQNGHYISRGCMYLRFSEDNCRPQCSHCNERLRGNLIKYAERLDSERPNSSETLWELSRTIYKYSRHELISMYSEYKTKVNNLLKQKQLKC